MSALAAPGFDELEANRPDTVIRLELMTIRSHWRLLAMTGREPISTAALGHGRLTYRSSIFQINIDN